MTILAILAVLFVAFLVAGAVFLIVPFLIGAGANALGSTVTGRSLNLGCLGYIVVAILGVIVGNALIGKIGPSIEGIHIVPAFVGSLIVTIILSLILNTNNRRRY